jgi:Putative ER transporter, 6TM, N-terminal/Fusaric acid resistance protein-like/Aromatic acid exporter family member 2
VATTARKATSPAASSSGTVVGSSGSKESTSYNAAASTVSGLGLFITIYIVSYLKAKRPQLIAPTIVYAIFTAVASTYAPHFPNMAASESFVKRLLETFLTGFGIAAAVSFFIFPMTSRTIAMKQSAGFLKLLQLSLKSHTSFMTSISAEDRKSQIEANGDHAIEAGKMETDEPHKHHIFHRKAKSESAKEVDARLSAEATAMKAALFKIGALFGKLHVEIGFAKREVAFGKLSPKDFSEITNHLRDILLPIIGMATFIDIMQSVKAKNTSEAELMESADTIEAIKRLRSEEWAEVFDMSHNQFKALQVAMEGGLSHVSYVLELEKKPKGPASDVEKADATPTPGSEGFGIFLEEEIQKFYKHRQEVLQTWCERKGIRVPSSFWDDPSQQYSMKDLPDESAVRKRENQRQLYLILYLRFLTWSTGNAILKMVRFADSKVADGTMKKKRLILPGVRRIRKLFESAWSKEEDTDLGIEAGQMTNIYMGASLMAKKDPEHLPPANVFEKLTDYIRVIPKILASPESSFGFRCAVATMSIGILAYLRQTEAFFLKQRLLWALIMLAISMTAHTGQSIFQFSLRIFGTFIAMCASLVIWYMCDQKPAAIIPVFYLYMCCGFYVLAKFPKYAIVAILSMVTVILIIGYELQVSKLGLKLATSNGQPYYPIYELAPYRLATVAGGLLVAFIWTYFPYPVTTHSTLRKDLGRTLYLLANFYSCVHSTVEMRLTTGIKADPTKKKSPTYRLDKARHKVFSKAVIMLNQLREHSEFTKFEPTFGGKFPKKTYDELIQAMQNLFNYMALISYSSISFTEDSDDQTVWLQDFRRFTGDLNITSQEMTSTLCLASASVSNSQPLPPYLKLPRPFDLGVRMEAVDPEIISISHISQPCYAAFAVLEIASTLIAEEMGHVVRLVKELVGEVDFSFHIISTSSESSSISSTTALSDGSSDGKGKKE